MGMFDEYNTAFRNLGVDESLRGTLNFHLSWNKERGDIYESSNLIAGYQNAYRGLTSERGKSKEGQWQKKLSIESVNTNNIDPQAEVFRALSRNAFSSFSQDVFDLSVSGTKVISKVLGNFNIGLDSSFFDPTLSVKEQDKRREQWEGYVASNVYQYLFKHETTQVGNQSLYGGLFISKPIGWYAPEVWEGDRTTMALGNWLMNHILTTEEIGATRRVSEYHQELIRGRDTTLTNRQYGKFTDITERVRDVSNQLLSTTDYVAKPGIRSAIAFIESAEKELTIDLFQLQNKAVADVLIKKLERESGRIARGEFKFQLRLAGPTNNNRANLVGHQILGPNIVILERLYNLQKKILDKEFDLEATATVSNKIAISNEERALDINTKIARLLPSFTIEMMTDGMYHPKVYTSERYAMLGSFNLTSPVGNSIHQAGSNYEEIIIFHNRMRDILNPISTGFDTTASISQKIRTINKSFSESSVSTNYIQNYRSLRSIGSLSSYGLSQPSSSQEEQQTKEYIDTHLFLQTRALALSGIHRSIGKDAFTGTQVGLAGDIGQGLRTILSYAKDKTGYDSKRVEVYMNLNQVWLLQYDNDLYYGKHGDFSGEFGPDTSRQIALDELTGKSSSSRRSIYRNEIQENLFDLIINKQAYVSVDIGNYRERVLEPMTHKVHYLLGKTTVESNLDFYKPKGWTGGKVTLSDFTEEDFKRIGSLKFEREYNSSLQELTHRHQDNNSLLRVLGLDSQGINYQDSLKTIDETYKLKPFFQRKKVALKAADRTIKQLLAMTRGGVIGVTETMSHVKNVFAIERTGVGLSDDSYHHIASISGSSNFGSESLVFNRDDTAPVSSEVGVISLARDMREYGQSSGILYRDDEEGLSSDVENIYAQQGTDREREWRRLTQTTVGSVDSSLSSTKASWESRVNATGIAEITARVNQFNKDLGLNKGGLSVKNIYGQGGSLIALELTINPAEMVGYRGFKDTQVGFNPIKFRLTSLKGGMGSKQGFVYLIDQNKVIGNSLFVNNTNEDIRGLPYGEGSFIRNEQTGEYELNPTVLKSRETLRLSPIDTLMNVVTTLSAEVTYRTLVAEPFQYMKALKRSQYTVQDTRLALAGLGYLEYLSRGHISSGGQDKYAGEFLLENNLSDYEISRLIDTFTTKHLDITLSSTSRKSLELTGGHTYSKLLSGEGTKDRGISKNQIFGDTDLALRRAIVNYLEVIRDANREINSKDTSNERIQTLQELKKDVVGAIKESFDRYMGLENVSLFQSDIALGIIESRKDFLYNSKLLSDIKEVQAGLLEPFITQSQASTYGSSQAWLKTPLYGINRNQTLFVNKLLSGNALYRYALAQSYIFGPSSTTGVGTEGAIRGVAAGGSISPTQESTGLSIYGINKTPIGDISSVHMASFAGVGYVTTRSEYTDYIIGLLLDKYSPSLMSIGITTPDALTAALQNPLSLPPGLIKDFKDLIAATPFKEDTVQESINYTFNVVKKVSQIPQRLKNVLGGRPMFELNRDISYRLITKGDVLGLIDKKIIDLKIELLSHLTRKDSLDIRRVVDILKSLVADSSNSSYLSSPSRLLEEAVRIIQLDSSIKINPSELLTTLSSLWSKVESGVGSNVNLAVINDAGFRGVVNNETANLIEEAKQELKDEYGFLDSEFLPGSNSIARKLLLNRARLADSMTGGIKGFTGSREAFDPLVLVQLTGDYSDYAWANPLYGSTKEDREFITSKLRSVGYEWKRLDKVSQAEIIGRMGTMSGFIDKSEKRQKSSKLSEDWSHKGVKLADKGDIVTFDPETNRVLVWGSTEEMMRQNGGVPKESYRIDHYSKEIKLELLKSVLGDKFDAYYTYSDLEGKYVVKSVVDARDQVGILSEVIDNFRTINDLPNVSRLDRKAWHRASENSVEFIMDSKQLMGNADNNQLLWETVYLRSILLGGGKRIESTGGLPKAVLKFTGLEELYETPGGKTDFFSFLVQQLNINKGGAIGDIEVGQVFGLFSPSNLKSYFYSHGSTIIRNKKYLEPLIGSLETQQGGVTGKGLIASLLLGFGDSWISDKGINSQIKTQLFESAMRGELGEWFKNQALGAILTGVSKDEELKAHLEKLGVKNDFTKLSQILDASSPVYEETSPIRTRLGKVFGDALFKKSKDLFNAQQTPSLQLLEDIRVLGALQGNQQDVEYIKGFVRSKLLSSIGDRGFIGATKRDFIRIDNPAEREAALIAASIDLVEQLRGQTKGIEIPSEIDYSNDRIIQQLAFIMGDADLDKIQLARDLREKQSTLDSLTQQEQEALDYLELTRAIVKGYTHRSTVLRMFIGPMASQSKESIGSKHTGSLEFQHLMKPMVTVITTFEETGSIASLRKVVANMLAVVSEGSTMTGIELDLAQRSFGSNKIYDFTDIRLVSQLNKDKFLGLYAGYSSINKELLTQIETDYATYGSLSRQVVESALRLLPSQTDKNQRMDTLRLIHDLLISSPNFSDLYRDPFTGEVSNVDSKGDRIRQIFDFAFKPQTEGGLGLTPVVGSIDDIPDLINRVSDEYLLSIGREYQTDPNKPFGMGSVAPVLDNLKYKGFSFSLPMIYQMTDEDTNGSMRVQLDFNDRRYSYLMGGEELKAIGDSYGSFVDELVAKSLILASAFTPGTIMSQVREKMSRAQLSGSTEINLTKEEVIAIRQFYTLAIGDTGVIRTMAEASTGSRIQGMMAHKTKFPGAVSSPAASWMVPMGHMVLAQEALRRFSHTSPIRNDISLSLRVSLSHLDESSPLYELETRAYISAITATQSGLSPTSSDSLSYISSISQQFQSLDLSSDSGKQQALLLSNALQSSINTIDVSNTSGDSFAKQLALLTKVRIDIALGNTDAYIKEGQYTSIAEKRRRELTRRREDLEGRITPLSKTLEVVENVLNKGIYKEVMETHDRLTSERSTVASFIKDKITPLSNPSAEEVSKLINDYFPNLDTEAQLLLENEVYSRLNLKVENDFITSTLGTPGSLNPEDVINSSDIASIESALRTKEFKVLREEVSSSLSSLKAQRRLINDLTSKTKDLLNLSSESLLTNFKTILPNVSDSTLSRIDTLFTAIKQQTSLQEQMQLLQEERRILTSNLKPNSSLSPDERKSYLDSLRLKNEEISTLSQKQQELKSEHKTLFNRRIDIDTLPAELADVLLKEYSDLETNELLKLRSYFKGIVPEDKLDIYIKSLTQQEPLPRVISDALLVSNTKAQEKNRNRLKEEFKSVISSPNLDKFIDEIISRDIKDLDEYRTFLTRQIANYNQSLSDFDTELLSLSQLPEQETRYRSSFGSNLTYSSKEEAVAALTSYINSSIDSDLNSVISNRHLMEGSYRGKVKAFSFDRDYLKGLSSDTDRRDMFSFVIGEMKEGFSLVLNELQSRDTNTFRISEAHQGITDSNRQSLSTLISILDSLQSGVSSSSLSAQDIDSIDRLLLSKDSSISVYSLLGTTKEQVQSLGSFSLEGKKGFERSISLLEVSMNALDMTDALEALSFRSPPVGGTEQQRMAVGLIQDIGLLNRYASFLQGNKASFDNSIRNKGLSLVAPISFLTMNLGDFDGDQYTTIFSQFMSIQRDIAKSNILIKKKEGDISRLESSLSSINDPLLLSSTQDKLTKLKSDIQQERSKIVDFHSQLDIWKETLNASDFTLATKKEVANFLGIRKEFLLSTSEGGYQSSSPSLDLIFSEIYFGRDLFGGMEGVLDGTNSIKSVLSTIFSHPINAEGRDSSLFDVLSSESDVHKLDQSFISTLESIVRSDTDSKHQSTYLSLLMVDQEARASLLSTVRDSLNSHILPLSEQEAGQQELDREVILAHASSAFYARYRGLPGLQSVLSQGAGVNMTLNAYDSMVKVMGEAGGVVLGKTYNTFIGTLYSDSPLLALSHVLKEDSTRELLRQGGFFDAPQQGVIKAGIDVHMSEDQFYNELNKSTQQSEGILSFIKSVNQLLRDGIKPKGGSGFLDDMNDFALQYENLKDDPLAQQALVKEKASLFGPSGSNVGMSAFMELSDLINQRDTLSKSTLKNQVTLSNGELIPSWDDTNEEIQSLLRTNFNIGQDEFNLLSSQLLRNYNREQISAFDIAALKTQRSLETLIIAYRYNTDTGAEYFEKGTQVGFMNNIVSGTIGLMKQQGIYNESLSDDRANLQSYIDTKFNSRTASGARNLYILQQMFGVDASTIQSNYLDVSSTEVRSGRKKDMLPEVLSMIEIIETTTSMTTGMMGKAGEGLLRFSNLEGARQEAVSAVGGRSDSNLHPGMGSDIWTSLMNLAGSNKLSSHAIPVIWEAFASSEILSSLYSNGVTSIESLLPSLLSGVIISGDKDNPSYEFAVRGGRNADQQQEMQLRLMLYRILSEGQDIEVEVGEGSDRVKKNLAKYITNKLETTASIAKGKALIDMMNKLYGPKGDVESYLNGSIFVEGIINRKALLSEEITKVTNEFISQGLDVNEKSLRERINTEANNRVNSYTQDLQGKYESSMIEFMFLSQSERRKVNNNRLPQEINSMRDFDYMNVLKSESNANRLSSLQDFILPAALTLLGSAVLGGRLDREVLGDVVGSSLIAASMAKGNILSSMLTDRISLSPTAPKSSFAKHSLSAAIKGIGSTFKLNLALQESEGDLSKALVLSTGRELGFALGSMILAPSIEKGLTNSFFYMSHAMKGQRELFEKTMINRLSKEDKLMYMLGSTHGPIDSDSYVGTKGSALTLSGAILSGVLGMMMEGITGNLVSSLHDTGSINDFALIDQALDALNISRSRDQTLASERESNPDIFNEQGESIFAEDISPFDEELFFLSVNTDFSDIDQLDAEVTSDGNFDVFIC